MEAHPEVGRRDDSRTPRPRRFAAVPLSRRSRIDRQCSWCAGACRGQSRNPTAMYCGYWRITGCWDLAQRCGTKAPARL